MVLPARRPPEAPSPPLTRLKLGVGPYFPTPGENRKQFEPLAEYLSRRLNVPVELTVVDNWVGISEALRTRTLDVAWLGPLGLRPGPPRRPVQMQAIATVKYKGKPTYLAVLVAPRQRALQHARRGNRTEQEGVEAQTESAPVGSTSGWLIRRRSSSGAASIRKSFSTTTKERLTPPPRPFPLSVGRWTLLPTTTATSTC